VSTP
jgi:hypothetical protein